MAGDKNNERHLRHLDLYELAEQGDFSYWLTSPIKTQTLALYAVRDGRCDIIEQYAPRVPESPYWNRCLALYYNRALYPILSLVMVLPVSLVDVTRYVRHGLHREVMVHIVGRVDHKSGETITLESIARWFCKSANSVGPLLALESVGLDLGDPSLLYVVLEESDFLGFCGHAITPAIELLRKRCDRLDETMPNGKTLREMLE